MGQGCFCNIWHWGRVQAPHVAPCQAEGHHLVWSHQHTWRLLPTSVALPAALRAMLPAPALSQLSFLLRESPKLTCSSPCSPYPVPGWAQRGRVQGTGISQRPTAAEPGVSESRNLSCLPGRGMPLFLVETALT